jgi:NAD(P)-dependent dehydrogenase (short-subunit alcohol dehydrogenase family)
MTKSLGKQFATDDLLVNAVAPAVTAPPMNEATAPAVLDYMVAERVSWLASERCSFSTAAVFDLTGGRATY